MEQRRLDDLDELEQIKLLKTVREKEQAKLQRQAEKAERAAAAGGGEGGGVTKKAKISNETMMADFGGAALLNQFQNQVIGTAKGQEESPGNSPRPTTIGDPLLS